MKLQTWKPKGLMSKPWRRSWACVELIKASEGYRERAFPDYHGRYQCGWGHTNGVEPDTTCDLTKAELWLSTDLDKCDAALNAKVTVKLTQGMVDALDDWIYNLGVGEFASAPGLALLNKGDYQAAWRHFYSYIYAGGHKSPGLMHRREEERQLFFSAV